MYAAVYVKYMYALNERTSKWKFFLEAATKKQQSKHSVYTAHTLLYL